MPSDPRITRAPAYPSHPPIAQVGGERFSRLNLAERCIITRLDLCAAELVELNRALTARMRRHPSRGTIAAYGHVSDAISNLIGAAGAVAGSAIGVCTCDACEAGL